MGRYEKTVISEDKFRQGKFPEQLNDYIHVTRPSVWLILGAVTLLLLGVVIWGIFGSIDGAAPVRFIIQ